MNYIPDYCLKELPYEPLSRMITARRRGRISTLRSSGFTLGKMLVSPTVRHIFHPTGNGFEIFPFFGSVAIISQTEISCFWCLKFLCKSEDISRNETNDLTNCLQENGPKFSPFLFIALGVRVRFFANIFYYLDTKFFMFLGQK